MFFTTNRVWPPCILVKFDSLLLHCCFLLQLSTLFAFTSHPRHVYYHTYNTGRYTLFCSILSTQIHVQLLPSECRNSRPSTATSTTFTSLVYVISRLRNNLRWLQPHLPHCSTARRQRHFWYFTTHFTQSCYFEKKHPHENPFCAPHSRRVLP